MWFLKSTNTNKMFLLSLSYTRFTIKMQKKNTFQPYRIEKLSLTGTKTLCCQIDDLKWLNILNASVLFFNFSVLIYFPGYYVLTVSLVQTAIIKKQNYCYLTTAITASNLLVIIQKATNYWEDENISEEKRNHDWEVEKIVNWKCLYIVQSCALQESVCS